MSEADDYMAVFSNTENFVALWTGIKAQFIEAGWSPVGAEQMTIEFFRMNNINNANPQ